MSRVSVIVALVLLAGCGGDDGESTSRRTTGGSSSPAATTTTASPTTATGTAAPSPAHNPGLDQPLIRAARRGDADRVADLLARGASVRARTGNGATALVEAAYRNHLDAATLLIEAGADVNRQDRTQQSAYLISTSEVGDDPRLLSMTLAAGADVGSLDSFDGTGLIRAADRGNVAVVRRLLATGIRVDHVNNLGWTALHEAVILGDGSRRYVRTVQALVDAGADVDKPSRRDGVRPLQHAQSRGFTEIERALRRAGAR